MDCKKCDGYFASNLEWDQCPLCGALLDENPPSENHSEAKKIETETPAVSNLE